MIEGDPDGPELWAQVDAALKRVYYRADGRPFSIQAACIDSGGHHTTQVYDFAKARLGRKIWAIKGEAARGGARSPIWPTKKPSSRMKSSFRPVILGVNAAKDTIRTRLHIKPPENGEPTPGYMHFPADRDINYFAQLVAERSIVKMVHGQKFRIWEVLPGRANEALDCRVYAYAALHGLMHFGLKLNRWVELVSEKYVRPHEEVLATSRNDVLEQKPQRPAGRVVTPSETKSAEPVKKRFKLAGRMAGASSLPHCRDDSAFP